MPSQPGLGGNPFGNRGGPWISDAKLRALFNAGLTYDEVAEINERGTSWRPSRAVVKRKYEAMGMPPRRPSHRDLIPWPVLPEHNSSVIRHMLQAESRARNGGELSDTDRKLTSRLHDVLFGRGTPMVVTYHPEVGFAFVLQDDSDDGLIRPGAYGTRALLDKALKSAGDSELVELATKAGIRPEVLENAGRDGAADRLRLELAEADPDEVPEDDAEDAATVPRAGTAGTG